MIRGKTESGFEFELDEDILDDYELLEMLTDIDDGDYGKTTTMVTCLLGKDQVKKLKDHLRSENGKVSAKKMLSEVGEIFNSCNKGKN